MLARIFKNARVDGEDLQLFLALQRGRLHHDKAFLRGSGKRNTAILARKSRPKGCEVGVHQGDVRTGYGLACGVREFAVNGEGRSSCQKKKQREEIDYLTQHPPKSPFKGGLKNRTLAQSKSPFEGGFRGMVTCGR